MYFLIGLLGVNHVNSHISRDPRQFGYRFHSVAVGLADGKLLDEFEIPHTKEGFESFFKRIRQHELKQQLSVSLAMEGYNGYARPLDQMIRARNYRELPQIKSNRKPR